MNFRGKNLKIIIDKRTLIEQNCSNLEDKFEGEKKCSETFYSNTSSLKYKISIDTFKLEKYRGCRNINTLKRQNEIEANKREV